MGRATLSHTMANLVIKVVVICTLVFFVHGAKPECRGKSKIGRPCQGGAGICTPIDGKGTRFGQNDCVLTTTPVPPTPFDTEIAGPGGATGPYGANNSMELCWTSPDGSPITLTFPAIQIECLSFLLSCFNSSNCQFDYLLINDGVQAEVTLCSTHTNYVYVGQSDHVCLTFVSDHSFNGGFWTVIATY